MNVDSEEYQLPAEVQTPDPNGVVEKYSQSPPPPQSCQSVAPTALSPPPLPESSAQTPAPVPEPTPVGPYRPDYKPHLILSGHSRSISSVKFSPDGKMLASCGEWFVTCIAASVLTAIGSKLPINLLSCGMRKRAISFTHSKGIRRASRTSLGRAMASSSRPHLTTSRYGYGLWNL